MFIYLAFDRKSGRVVHVHHSIDAAGQSCTCSDEEVVQVLPRHIDPGTVGVVPVELEQMPSSRAARFVIDPKSRQVLVRSLERKGGGKPSSAKPHGTRKKGQ